jgi:hypothetical protein
MINKLYISPVDYDWKNSNLVFLNGRNLNKIISNIEALDCYTSPEDLLWSNISVACDNAIEIILVKIDENIVLTNDTCSLYGRLFNECLKHNTKVKNFTWSKDFNYLENIKNNVTPTLWTAGCSVTAGTGVDYKDRWGTLLAEYLNLPEVTLSKLGTSVGWAADQILRSDIKEGDIVVWGLTSIPRVQISRNWNFESVSIRAYPSIKKEEQYWNIDYFNCETLVLTTVRHILQVINFCKKIKVTLYLVNLIDLTWLGIILKDFENFIDLTHDLPTNNGFLCYIDLGTDNDHPGPKQHSKYATTIYDFIKESNHGKTI